MHSLLNQAKVIALHLVNEVVDVDLVLAFGSLARGSADEFSDFDLLVFSNSIRVNWSFVLQGRPVTLWTVTWEEAEQVAKGLQGAWCVATAFLLQYEILWSKSKQLETRFQNLSKQVRNGSQNALERSLSKFSGLYGSLWRLQGAIQHNDVLTPAFLVWNIANPLIEILAALNQQPLFNNWGNQLTEIKQFQIMPPNFISRFTELVTSPPKDILPIATSLVKDVFHLLKTWFYDQKISESSFLQEITNKFPGVIDCLNKIRSAVNAENLVSARAAAVEYAEFAIWLFRGMMGTNANVRHFEIAREAIAFLPSNHQVILRTLLTSMEFDQLVEAAEQLTTLLQSEFVKKKVNLPLVSSVKDAKEYLRIDRI